MKNFLPEDAKAFELLKTWSDAQKEHWDASHAIKKIIDRFYDEDERDFEENWDMQIHEQHSNPKGFEKKLAKKEMSRRDQLKSFEKQRSDAQAIIDSTRHDLMEYLAENPECFQRLDQYWKDASYTGQYKFKENITEALANNPFIVEFRENSFNELVGHGGGEWRAWNELRKTKNYLQENVATFCDLILQLTGKGIQKNQVEPRPEKRKIFKERRFAYYREMDKDKLIIEKLSYLKEALNIIPLGWLTEKRQRKIVEALIRTMHYEVKSPQHTPLSSLALRVLERQASQAVQKREHQIRFRAKPAAASTKSEQESQKVQ